jgi:hypothetical protein
MWVTKHFIVLWDLVSNKDSRDYSVVWIINLYRTAFKFRFRAKGTEFSPRQPFKSLRVFNNKCLYIMKQMWCNNAIIYTVLRINRRYFSSKKDSVEMFNAYMQEVNLKFYNFPLILLTFLFRARRMHRKFQLQDLWHCALAWWCQKHHLTPPSLSLSHTHTHTHTSYFLNMSQLFSSHNPLFTHDTVINRERPMFLEFCSSIPTCIIISSMFLTIRNREFLHCISLLSQGKSKTGIFQRLSKNA